MRWSQRGAHLLLQIRTRVERRVRSNIPHLVSELPGPHATIGCLSRMAGYRCPSDLMIGHRLCPGARYACTHLTLPGLNPTEQVYYRTHEATPRHYAPTRDHLPHPGFCGPARMTHPTCLSPHVVSL
jgi:hypothetical protein